LVQIEITDRGPGIPQAELEAIFEAFVQSSKTKDGAGGTGLGLAICRKIMQAHGGQIQAFNRAGGGSCFRITLTCLEPAEMAERAPTGPPKPDGIAHSSHVPTQLKM
jgi:signal transduction histidine kinase